MASKLNNIQGLRAYAALSVTFFHSGYLLPRIAPFGFYGVDVFFVISGFIMAGICDLRPHKFFARRVLRIVPMYWLATVAIFVLAAIRPGLLKATHASWVELTKSLLFIPFMKGDGLLQPLLFVGWSLNYEMYFYVLLGLALMVVCGKRAPLLASAVVLCVPALLWPWHTSHSAWVQFYSSTRTYEFVLGVVAYHGARRVPASTARQLRWPLVGASAICVAELAVYFMLPLRWFPPDWIGFGMPALVLVMAAALLARCGHDIRSRWIILLGDASYAIYLLHPYVLYFQERVLARRWPWLSTQHSFTGMAIGMVLVSVVSCTVYLHVEKPLTDWLAARYAHTPNPAQAFLSEVPL
jgi:peptidoglycan/LPS O-acetylase OafA/YrhL